MSADLSSHRVEESVDKGLSGTIHRHPLASFFIFAFVGSWLLFVPILLSPRGFGVVDIPDSLGFAFFLLSTYAGPFIAAWIVTRLVSGRSGVRQWFGRMLQWRIHWGWYALVLLAYPIAFGLPAILLEGRRALQAAGNNLPQFIAGYLLTLVVGFFAPTLGEEAGWRGFALTRLQNVRGPLTATLIVSALHALWHLPAYFVKGAISETGVFDPWMFIANSLAIVAASVVWTWLFNNAAGSIFFATFVHAASNAMSGNLIQWLELGRPNIWFAFGISAVLALLVVILSRGRLGYRSPDAKH